MSPIEDVVGVEHFQLSSVSPGPTPRSRRKASHRIRVALAVEQALFRDGLRSWLRKYVDVNVVEQGVDCHHVLTLVERVQPEILLLEMSPPYIKSFEILSKVASASMNLGIVVLADELSRTHTVRALRYGVRGFVLKTSDSMALRDAIRKVSAGQYWLQHENLVDLIQAAIEEPATNEEPKSRFGLTGREGSVLLAVLDGYTNPEIGDKLGLSEQTVKHHLSRIFDKLGVYSRLELALFAVNHHLVGD